MVEEETLQPRDRAIATFKDVAKRYQQNATKSDDGWYEMDVDENNDLVQEAHGCRMFEVEGVNYQRIGNTNTLKVRWNPDLIK